MREVTARFSTGPTWQRAIGLYRAHRFRGRRFSGRRFCIYIYAAAFAINEHWRVVVGLLRCHQ
jgi:hypothetical protein